MVLVAVESQTGTGISCAVSLTAWAAHAATSVVFRSVWNIGDVKVSNGSVVPVCCWSQRSFGRRRDRGVVRLPGNEAGAVIGVADPRKTASGRSRRSSVESEWLHTVCSSRPPVPPPPSAPAARKSLADQAPGPDARRLRSHTGRDEGPSPVWSRRNRARKVPRGDGFKHGR